ncbi:MAG: hypothetical protein V4654_12315 [Bdellovibrionota bacterium]
MSGEASKVTGDLGEQNAKKFFEFLGWKSLSATSLDFECVLEAHKTPTGKDKKAHGIDFVYSYECPYSKVEKVILVDSKALKWEDRGENHGEGKTKNEVSGFFNDLHKKLNCAKISKDLKEKLGIGSRSDYIGLIFYFCHDQFFDKVQLVKALEDVSVPRDAFTSTSFVLDNSRINLLYSMFKKIESLKLQIGKGAEHSFCYFDLERFPMDGSLHNYLTLQSMFSNFIFVKISNNDGASTNHVFYFGAYSPDAIKMFASALYKFQIYLMDNLHFYPVSMKSALGNMHAIEQYFSNGFLKIGDKAIKIECSDIDNIDFRLK